MKEKLILDVHTAYEKVVLEELLEENEEYEIVGLIVKVTESSEYSWKEGVELIKKAAEVGLIVWAYHFFRSFTFNDPDYFQNGVAQAINYINVTDSIKHLLAGEICDLENFWYKQKGRDLNPYDPRILEAIHEWFVEVALERPGIPLIWYSNQNTMWTWQMYNPDGSFAHPSEMYWIDLLVKHLWEALYSIYTEPEGLIPLRDKKWLWQYTEHGEFPGIYAWSTELQKYVPTQVDVNRIQVPWDEFLRKIPEGRRGKYTLPKPVDPQLPPKPKPGLLKRFKNWIKRYIM